MAQILISYQKMNRIFLRNLIFGQLKKRQGSQPDYNKESILTLSISLEILEINYYY